MGTSGQARIALAGALVALVAALGAAFALASSGSADDGVFDVTMRNGAIDLERASLAHGRQVIEVANEGSAEHEIVVIRTDLPADELPVGLHGVSIAQAGELIIGEDHLTAGHNHPPGVVLGLEPGQTQRHQAKLAPGSYVVYCQTGSHYLAGERAALDVR